MERNIGDQLNKAYEAYRQASIERDNAKKELQQMVLYLMHSDKKQTVSFPESLALDYKCILMDSLHWMYILFQD